MIPSVYPLFGLGVCLLIGLSAGLCPYLKRVRGLVVLLGISMTFYCGSKGWHFSFDNKVKDNGSYCTNDLIVAKWTFETEVMECLLKAQYRNTTITNATGEITDPWHELPSAMVRDSEKTWVVEQATNMEVVCWADWIKPEPVTTNGVYHMRGVQRSMDSNPSTYVTPGIHIVAHLEDVKRTDILTPTNPPPSKVEPVTP